MAPTDVRLSETDVVQPDILVVCDPARITASHIEGAPDLVVEVLSPGTSAKVRGKKWLYQRSGVREYWVVDPLELYIQRFLLSSEGRYGEPEVFGPHEIVRSDVLDGVTVDLNEVFDWMEPARRWDRAAVRQPRWRAIDVKKTCLAPLSSRFAVVIRERRIEFGTQHLNIGIGKKNGNQIAVQLGHVRCGVKESKTPPTPFLRPRGSIRAEKV
jgi:hypothetical protein